MGFSPTNDSFLICRNGIFYARGRIFSVLDDSFRISRDRIFEPTVYFKPRTVYFQPKDRIFSAWTVYFTGDPRTGRSEHPEQRTPAVRCPVDNAGRCGLRNMIF